MSGKLLCEDLKKKNGLLEMEIMKIKGELTKLDQLVVSDMLDLDSPASIAVLGRIHEPEFPDFPSLTLTETV